MLPLEQAGVQFCTNDATRSQLYNDPANKTLHVLQQLLAEMASLFEDEVTVQQWRHVSCALSMRAGHG
jgi:uncharacterized SAM-dependent methyltransferase